MKFFSAIMLLALITFSREATAYQFTSDFNRGFYWGTFPFGLSSFVVAPSDGPLLASLVDQAEDAWENSVGSNIWNHSGFSVSTGFSGNNVRWSNNFSADTGYDPGGTLAVTVRYATGTHIIKTEIILNGENNQLRANLGGILYRTILHEMGHTIGLDHSTEDAVMAAYLTGHNMLQFDDVQGGNAVISEALFRQATGFVSQFSTQPEEEVSGSCGSVALIGDNNDGGGNGFAGSLVIGLALVMFFSRKTLKLKT